MKEAKKMLEDFLASGNINHQKLTPSTQPFPGELPLPQQIQPPSKQSEVRTETHCQIKKSHFEVKENHKTSSSKEALFSPEMQAEFERYTGGQQRKIVSFWYELIKCYGQGKVRQEFGDEPSRHMMRFAAEIEQESYHRLMNNLKERILKGHEWPPSSIVILEKLSITPTDNEILEARTNLITIGKPLTRVETYIHKRKQAKLRTLSEQYMVNEFRILYLEAFQEVIFQNLDLTFDEKESQVLEATLGCIRSKHDRHIDAKLKGGYKPQGLLGERLARLSSLIKTSSSH